MLISWLKVLHIITLVTWFAALFYLPRLFVYHCLAKDSISIDRFKIMERRLYLGIMTPSFILTTIFGFWMLYESWQLYYDKLWLQIKLLLVFILIAYHFLCGYFVRVFAQNKNIYSDRFYRWFNELPSILLISIVILVVIKPFN